MSEPHAAPPEISVVIASINGWPYLASCLAALQRQQGAIMAEVIVADCVGASVTEPLKAAYPEVRLIAFDQPRSVPDLRAAGMLAAQGSIIAITEDHCIPDEHWYTAISAAHARFPEPAIGGAVDNAATRRIIDWAVYFCEYSAFISPVPAAIVHDLPGPNVSYKRSALGILADLVQDGYWETFLHWRLESQNLQLRSEPSIRVLHRKHFEFRSFLNERFHYARAFAGTRNEFMSPLRRLIYLCGSPLLPPLMLWRIGQRVWQRQRHLPAFICALPPIFIFTLAWAAGELVGYAIGPGDSALQLT